MAAALKRQWQIALCVVLVLVILLVLVRVMFSGPPASQWLRSDPRLLKLDWTSLDRITFHFVSAYFDNRDGAPRRPAVLIVGYSTGIRNDSLYCVFSNSSGSRQCLKTPAEKVYLDQCVHQVRAAKILHVICEMGVGEDPPEFVQLSTSSNCDPKLFSGVLPVRNRNTSMTLKPPKKFGVCVGAPLVQERKNFLRDIIEFVEMSKLMGAEVIVMYVNETQVDANVLQHIWTHYPDTVRTIGWKKFTKYGSLHYYGQHLLISDCFYRMMYEVEYLAQFDTDEMIIPLVADNWSDMLTTLNYQSNHSVIFAFQNAFFKSSKSSKPKNLNFCLNVEVPKYFTRTERITCRPSFVYRAKTITRPSYALLPSIHKVCGLPGYKVFNVPTETALLGHFRISTPKDCLERTDYTVTTDTRVLKYFDSLRKRMCPEKG